jgi:hypothetical protein
MTDTQVFAVPTKVMFALSTARAPEEAADPLEWNSVAVASLDEIEDLLDLAECHGYREYEVRELGPDAFVVRWR